MYVSSYYYIRVRMQVVAHHIAMWDPAAAIYVSSYYYIRVRMQVVAHHIAMWDPAAADGKGRWSGMRGGGRGGGGKH